MAECARPLFEPALQSRIPECPYSFTDEFPPCASSDISGCPGSAGRHRRGIHQAGHWKGFVYRFSDESRKNLACGLYRLQWWRRTRQRERTKVNRDVTVTVVVLRPRALGAQVAIPTPASPSIRTPPTTSPQTRAGRSRQHAEHISAPRTSPCRPGRPTSALK